MVSLVNQTCVQTYDIPLLQNMVRSRNSVYYFVVYRYADGSGIAIVIQEIRNAASLSYELLPIAVNVQCGYSRLYKGRQFIVNLFQQFPAVRIKSISLADLIVTDITYAPNIFTIASNTASTF